jgi:hypothetical protein
MYVLNALEDIDDVGKTTSEMEQAIMAYLKADYCTLSVIPSLH